MFSLIFELLTANQINFL